MVKIEEFSDGMNRFLSRVYVSPEHAACFTGLDKLCPTGKDQFPSLTRKRIRKWAESMKTMFTSV